MRLPIKLTFVLPILSCVLLSCSKVTWPCIPSHTARYLSVLNEVVDQKRLASIHVNAPDALHELNPHGVRLYISWKLPKAFLDKEVNGLLKIRFNANKEVTVPFALQKLRGSFIYQVINQEFFEQEGILAYKVEVYSQGTLIDQYQHSMWTDFISSNP